LTRIRDAGVSLPLVAIGGIDTTNVADVMGAGAWGAAVITSILASDDPEAAARGLKSAMLDAIGLQPDPEIIGSVTEHATSNGR
jgi:thiamine monophosphate synthase